MQKKISDIARKGILDKLILIGQIPGMVHTTLFFNEYIRKQLRFHITEHLFSMK